MEKIKNKTYIEILKETMEFAVKAHGEQKTPHGFPYLYHLMSVEHEVLMGMKEDNSFQEHEMLMAMQCAILHDTIEDTMTTYEDIKNKFGSTIANGVLALTLDKNIETKAEQIKDSLKRIKEQPKWLWCVKLSDRITNMHTPPEKWDNKKKLKYKKDAEVIYEELKKASKKLANRLLNKIKEYDNYIDKEENLSL